MSRMDNENEMGIMLCGHGSRDAGAVREFCGLWESLDKKFPGIPTEYGFLEFANPVIKDGLDKLRKKGVKRIKALPGMLFAAGHVKNDVPSVLRMYEEEHKDISIDFGRELAIDLKLIAAAKDRIASVLGGEIVADKEAMASVMLVVVGRGSSDPDANSNVCKVTRLLWEGMGFGWAETTYSGVTFPLVGAGLEKVVSLGYKRVVVFPYFLFTGILVNRIYDAVDKVAAKHPNIDFMKAGYLSDHPLVIDTFIDRLLEIDKGTGVMNCKLCKYRETMLGFEDEVGLKQESHHHHVEGIGLGESIPHHHDSGSHHHHHHPYPHAHHPLGPRSMKE